MLVNMFFSLFLASLMTLPKVSAAGVTIQNDVISLSFDCETSALSSLVDKASGVDMVAVEDANVVALVPIWVSLRV